MLLVASESLRKYVTSCSQRCSCWWTSAGTMMTQVLTTSLTTLLTLNCTYTVTYGPLARYVKFRVAHASGMPGTFPPPPLVRDPDMHHGTCVTHVPWCMSGSLTSGFFWSRWRGKRSRHSGRMRNPKFYVSGKRSMDCLCGGRKVKVTRGVCAYHFNGRQRLWWEQGRRSGGFLCLYVRSMIFSKNHLYPDEFCNIYMDIRTECMYWKCLYLIFIYIYIGQNGGA